MTHERETATEALRRRDEQLSVALDAAQMGVWFWSATDNRLTWDDTLRRIYGLAPDDRVAGYEDFIARVHPDDREFVETSVRRALSEGGRLDYEFRIVLPDGRVRWIADLGSVVPGTGRQAGRHDRHLPGRDRPAHRRGAAPAGAQDGVGGPARGRRRARGEQPDERRASARRTSSCARADLPPAVRADAEYIRRAAERTAAVTAQLLAFSRRQVLRPQVLDSTACWSGSGRCCSGPWARTARSRCCSTPAWARCRPTRASSSRCCSTWRSTPATRCRGGGRLTVETAEVELTERSARRTPRRARCGRAATSCSR